MYTTCSLSSQRWVQICQKHKYLYKIYMEDGTFPQLTTTNVPYLAGCSFVALWLLLLLVIYRLQFSDSPPIVAIIALLLLNSLLELLFELPGYFSSIPNSVCLISITGTTFFRLASYYWLIFMARLLYRQKLQPGKFIDLSKYISKHLIFTYIPSVIVTLLVVIVANIDDTESEANCWRRITEKTATDYIIYMASFVLPNFIALLTILGYLFVYFKIKRKTSASLCLYLPLTAVPFIVYYLVLKIMTFFGQWDIINILEVPLACQPLVHGIIFAIILRNISRGKRPTSSDLTIAEESSFHESILPE